MGARRHGQEGALALPWEMCRLDSLQLQHFGLQKEKQNRCRKRHVSAAQIAIAAGTAPRIQLRELTALPDTHTPSSPLRQH